jgi:predicted lipoprotein
MTSLAVKSTLVYVFIRKKAEEMKHLSQALQTSIGHYAQTQERMLARIQMLFGVSMQGYNFIAAVSRWKWRLM